MQLTCINLDLPLARIQKSAVSMPSTPQTPPIRNTKQAARGQHDRALGRSCHCAIAGCCTFVCCCLFTSALGAAPDVGAPVADESTEASGKQEAPAGSEREREGEAPTQDPAGAAPTPQLTPPRVTHRVDAVYPPDLERSGQAGRVELDVTVSTEGRVVGVDVALSAGAEFDTAAIAAVRGWRFEPAVRDGVQVASRIRVPFEFTPPAPASETLPSGTQESPSPQAPSSKVEHESPTPPATQAQTPEADGHAQDAVDVVVHGRREPRTEHRSASDFRIGRDVIDAAPRTEGAEALRAAPGLYIGRSEGLAVAHRYMLRGFDADHGQDIEFRVGGLPINLPAHIHGQGYADLGFLIGETVAELEVSEGVSDPRQGDFAVAGSIDISLGVEGERRGVTVKSSYGAFDTTRHLALWAPVLEAEETLGAVSVLQTNGFGENRAGQQGSGVFQQRFGEGDQTYRAIGIVHATRSDHAGVLRRDDVDDARVCFHCVYDQATARAQNASSGRLLAGIFSDTTYGDRDNSTLGMWIGVDNFRLQSNYTGFVEHSRTLSGVAGRGDLIEQRNRTLSAGVTARYRSPRYRPAHWAHGTLEVGADGRIDDIEQAQNLIEAGRNETWDQRVDATVLGIDLGVWGDLDWVLTKYAHARLGLRADVLSYEVDDRLGNFVELSRPPGSFIQGFRRSALGLAWGPRTSVEVHPTEWLSLLAAYGEGYRSPQARQLEDGERAPYTKVRSGDVGAHVDWDEIVHLAAAGYYTQLSDDVAFDAAEGRLERIGATRRVGAVFHAYTKPLPWVTGALSVTYAHATLLEPPPATAEEPQPPFKEGQALPFVPPIVVRADAGAKRALATVRGQPLGTRVGSGLSYLSPRPLPYGNNSEPVTVLDVAAGVWWGPAELSFELFNLLDARYAAVEYNFASDWDPNDDVRPRTPARHIAAGAPFSWMLSLGVTL